MKSRVATVLGFTTFLTLVAMDAGADASFDAPKRLVALLGIAVAAILAIGPRDTPVRWSRLKTAIAATAGVALLLAAASALFSPTRDVAIDAARTLLLFALVPSLAAAAPAWTSVSRAFVAGASVNAAIALLQAFTIASPYRNVSGGGRGSAFALIGNSGALGIVAAFAIVILAPRVSRKSYGTWLLLALLATAVAIGGSTTPWAVVAVGLLARIPRLRALIPLPALLLLGACVSLETMHSLDRILTHRFAPWSAAVSMASERPLLGFGPGTFAAEYAAHTDPRFVNPSLAGAFAQAHNEPLQAAGEWGVPAAFFATLSFALLLWSSRRDPAIFAVLLGGAVAAMTWFPLQRPETALLLLVAAGQAWRDA